MMMGWQLAIHVLLSSSPAPKLEQSANVIFPLVSKEMETAALVLRYLPAMFINK